MHKGDDPEREIAVLQHKINRLETALAEAEYAMVGGNIIQEDVPWTTVDSWFKYIQQKSREANGKA